MKNIELINNNWNIDLIKSILQIEGRFTINDISENNDANGGITFSGIKKSSCGIEVKINIVMDKNKLEEINNCSNVEDIYEHYKGMGYFK